MEKKKTSFGSSLLLALAAFIWGVAFVAQSIGMDYMGPCTFLGSRFLIGAAVLVPFIWFRDRNHKAEQEKHFDAQETLPIGQEGQGARKNSAEKKTLLTGGICCGLALCSASLLQQIGIQYTSVGKAGFITTLYIILVPIFGIFLKKKIGKKVWTGAVIAVAGMYLLCVTESFTISRGDFFVLLCAFVYAVHILVVDHFAPRTDSVKLSCIQFFVSGVIGMILAFMFETPSFSALLAGTVPVLYAGVLSSGVAYTLQVVGQKRVEPTVASMILSMESVFSVLAGWLLLSQKLSGKELTGCVMVFAAVVMVQLPDRKKQEI